jgi:hypothetical protein
LKIHIQKLNDSWRVWAQEGLDKSSRREFDSEEQANQYAAELQSRHGCDMEVLNSTVLSPEQQVTLQILKNRYFDILSKEDYPNTPQITEEADNIEKAINKLKDDAADRIDHIGHS